MKSLKLIPVFIFGYASLSAQTGYIPKYNSATTFNSSTIFQSATDKVGIGFITPTGKLGVVGGPIRWGNTAETSELSTDQGGSIELGALNSTTGIGTPYLDFHYTGIAQDFNTRIINNGNNTLAFQNASGEVLTILNNSSC